MIESREQVLENFFSRARAFLESPGLLSGIDFDDATVTLKRYVLTELKDQELASTLARFQKLIRALDVATLADLVRNVEDRLAAR